MASIVELRNNEINYVSGGGGILYGGIGAAAGGTALLISGIFGCVFKDRCKVTAYGRAYEVEGNVARAYSEGYVTNGPCKALAGVSIAFGIIGMGAGGLLIWAGSVTST